VSRTNPASITLLNVNSPREDCRVKGIAGKCCRPRMTTTLASLNAARRWKISGKGIAHVASSLGMKSTEMKGTVRGAKITVVVTKIGLVESFLVVK
jgi:hypothetical protein